jgi:FMN phosphatase YigB (HAD superfamily)
MKTKIKIPLLVLSLFITVAVFYEFEQLYKRKTSTFVQVIESNSIEDVKKFIEPETLVIFDYDNVLVEGKLDYGFDAWFCAMTSELENNGMEKSVVVKKLLPIYEEIQQTAEVQPVEKCTKDLIEALKSAGHNVMVLTVRSLCLVDCVFRQLKSIDINIEQGAISENGINAALAKIGATYVNGILFCDGYYKGLALKAFLEGRPDLKVKKIVFIDDKLKNIESVKAAAQELGINFVGMRYGYTDARAKAYVLDEESKALVQKLLSDLKLISNSESLDFKSSTLKPNLSAT